MVSFTLIYGVFFSAQPIFTNDNRLTQYGVFYRNVDINVYVYSIPKYTTLRWYKGNIPVSSSTKYVVSERPAIVNDTKNTPYIIENNIKYLFFLGNHIYM
jgi:hypothetical protein